MADLGEPEACHQCLLQIERQVSRHLSIGLGAVCTLGRRQYGMADQSAELVVRRLG